MQHAPPIPYAPLPAEVLGQDGDHALHGSQHGAVHDDGPLLAGLQVVPAVARLAGLGTARVGRTVLRRSRRRLARGVLELEADRQLEVQLDGGALMRALQGIEDLPAKQTESSKAISR